MFVTDRQTDRWTDRQTDRKHQFYMPPKTRVLTRKNTPPPPPPGFWKNALWPYIIGTNLQTKLHDDWTKNVAHRVFTHHIWKNALPPGGNVFQETRIHFELTINVASRVLTKQMLMLHTAQRTKGNHKSSP
ncbi:hypothetical protein DPMN_178314 [Dreissena polymorpha]|uniref:Uncharacterized protein n=1 Tax=Dreissena polymorpha TaxID=45954 RepID=A0A9D4EET1_DREPO|nr:hypothetical protein DPMN_178314 [Dreissena polymorpha]